MGREELDSRIDNVQRKLVSEMKRYISRIGEDNLKEVLFVVLTEKLRELDIYLQREVCLSVYIDKENSTFMVSFHRVH